MIGRLARAVLAGIGTAYETLIPGPSIHGYRLDAAEALAEAEAEQEVSDGDAETWQCITAAEQSAYNRLIRDAIGPYAAPESPTAPVAGQRGENPAGGAPPTPAGSPTPGQFAAIAVHELLAEAFADIPNPFSSWVPDPWGAFDFDWHEVLADDIARRTDAAAARCDAQIDAQLRAAGFHASNTFPQHQKHQ